MDWTKRYDLYDWGDVTKKNWTEHLADKEEHRNACRVVIWKPEGSQELVKRRGRWNNNIGRNANELCSCVVGWTGFVWLRVGNP